MITAANITSSSKMSLIWKLDIHFKENFINRRKGVNIELKRIRRKNLKNDMRLFFSSVTIAGAVENKSMKNKPDLRYDRAILDNFLSASLAVKKVRAIPSIQITSKAN